MCWFKKAISFQKFEWGIYRDSLLVVCAEMPKGFYGHVELYGFICANEQSRVRCTPHSSHIEDACQLRLLRRMRPEMRRRQGILQWFLQDFLRFFYAPVRSSACSFTTLRLRFGSQCYVYVTSAQQLGKEEEEEEEDQTRKGIKTPLRASVQIQILPELDKINAYE